jgi:transposase
MAATVVEKAFCVLELAKTNSVTLVQRHFRRRYGKPPPTRQSIYDWRKKFQETGCLRKGKSSGRPPVSEETVELDCRIDICRVTKGSHIEYL